MRVVLLLAVLVATALAQSPNLPQLPTQYEAECHMRLPYANIDETIVTWYDGVNNVQRVDYYGGQDQYYYMGNNNASYEVVPTGLQSTTCFPTLNTTVSLQSVFPDLSTFQLVPGQVEVNGVQCYNWQYVTSQYNRTNTYNFYVSIQTGQPIQYHMLGYDSLYGSHYDEYVLTYVSIIPGVNSAAFQPPAQYCSNAQPSPYVHTMLSPLEELTMLHPYSQDYSNTQSAIDDMFSTFSSKFSRTYQGKEQTERRQTYYNNMRKIHAHNRQQSSYKLALNHLADWTPAEILARNNPMRPKASGNGASHYHVPTLSPSAFPDSFDWRDKGAVTPVKDQGICGSCWSFGSSQAIEGAYFLKTGSLPVLSQQILVDCSWPFGNNGCDGGLDFQAFQWVMSNGGIVANSDYPYMMADGRCHFDNTSMTVYPISGYVNVTRSDENALIDALLRMGPISVSIDASHWDFSFYSTGVYYNAQCRNDVDGLDHSVLLVGYGTENGQDYWIIKNSWSTHYGDNGYVLMSRLNNNCGVATEPTYVLV